MPQPIASRAPLGVLLACCLLAACSGTPRRYPLAPPLWVDADRNPVPKKPGDYYSGLLADGADQMALRPLGELFAFHLPGESTNVNAVDEVPNSSWFINRLGLFDISPERAARAACGNAPPLDPKRGPWVVSGAKPNGANPGFFIKTPQGRYLLKFDSALQPQRATAADVIGSKIYWAAGYHTPCNQIVYFRRSVLKIGAKATTEDKYGKKHKATDKDIDKVLAAAFRTKDGVLRASASKFVKGRPLGPFRYEGTRSDDPNDVIDHRDRRELRANRVLSAWLNHFDAREQNSLDVWTKEEGRGFIRHYYIDWGDCLGSRWPLDGISRRLGYSYYFDAKHVAVDLITLGLMPRPWNRAKISAEAEIFGYFGTRDFDPDAWRGGYAGPAFERMTFRDALWMVRIIARFTDAHLRAIVRAGHLDDPRAEAYLVRTLAARRDIILRHYLTRWPSLAHFRLVRRKQGLPEQSLCFDDLATKHRVIDRKKVVYKLRFYGGKKIDQELGWLQFSPDRDHPGRSCVLLPIGDKRPADLAPAGAPDNHPLRYGVLKIFIQQKPAIPPTSSIWLHLYDLGPQRGYRLVGIDRRPKPVMPDLY